MTKRFFISIFILASLIFAPFSSIASAATVAPTKTNTVKTSVKKSSTSTTKKKTAKKKKKGKRKEKLILNPPLITLDTAPHSPKKVIAKAKSKKKTKKRA